MIHKVSNTEESQLLQKMIIEDATKSPEYDSDVTERTTLNEMASERRTNQAFRTRNKAREILAVGSIILQDEKPTVIPNVSTPNTKAAERVKNDGLTLLDVFDGYNSKYDNGVFKNIRPGFSPAASAVCSTLMSATSLFDDNTQNSEIEEIESRVESINEIYWRFRRRMRVDSVYAVSSRMIKQETREIRINVKAIMRLIMRLNPSLKIVNKRDERFITRLIAPTPTEP